MDRVEVVLANNDRVTLRVGGVFLKVDTDQTRTDVIAGYGGEVDRDVIRAWQSWRCLTSIRWLFENGYGPPDTYPEVAVLRSRS